MRIDESGFMRHRERLGSLALVYKNTTLHNLFRFLEKEKVIEAQSIV